VRRRGRMCSCARVSGGGRVEGLGCVDATDMVSGEGYV
jgi:hypothetical protein